ncbi:alpha/beta fold hydrolase [Streptomyces sp. NPDC046977]|uniref:alpha/beta fold hydrolase n=1 Tax=Streptomyces sp. NPDC046977 TaxID=3154703 RepID=UPI0033FC01DB
MATAHVNGITVAYDDDQGGGGKGVGGAPAVPLLLVHGHPFDRSLWAPQVAAVAGTGRRVIAPDLRGYGASEVVPGITPLGTFARDLAALLDHLGVARVVLGGLSMGGQIVMEFQRTFPERVAALVLTATFPGADTEDGRKAREATADRLLDEGMAKYADEVLDRMITPYNVTTRPDVAAHVLRMMRGTPPEGAAAALRGRARRPDYGPVLAAVRVPTLIVVGRDDTFTPVAEAEAMHRIVTGSRLAVVESSGHLPNLERPEVFTGLLRDFLDELDA